MGSGNSFLLLTRLNFITDEHWYQPCSSSSCTLRTRARCPATLPHSAPAGLVPSLLCTVSPKRLIPAAEQRAATRRGSSCCCHESQGDPNTPFGNCWLKCCSKAILALQKDEDGYCPWTFHLCLLSASTNILHHPLHCLPGHGPSLFTQGGVNPACMNPAPQARTLPFGIHLRTSLSTAALLQSGLVHPCKTKEQTIPSLLRSVLLAGKLVTVRRSIKKPEEHRKTKACFLAVQSCPQTCTRSPRERQH